MTWLETSNIVRSQRMDESRPIRTANRDRAASRQIQPGGTFTQSSISRSQSNLLPHHVPMSPTIIFAFGHAISRKQPVLVVFGRWRPALPL